MVLFLIQLARIFSYLVCVFFVFQFSRFFLCFDAELLFDSDFERFIKFFYFYESKCLKFDVDFTGAVNNWPSNKKLFMVFKFWVQLLQRSPTFFILIHDTNLSQISALPVIFCLLHSNQTVRHTGFEAVFLVWRRT